MFIYNPQQRSPYCYAQSTNKVECEMEDGGFEVDNEFVFQEVICDLISGELRGVGDGGEGRKNMLIFWEKRCSVGLEKGMSGFGVFVE